MSRFPSSNQLRSLAIIAICLGCSIGLNAQEAKGPTVSESLENLVASKGKREKARDFYMAYNSLSMKLDGDKQEAEKIATDILAKTKDLLPEGAARKTVEEAEKAKGKVAAAHRLLDLSRSVSTVKSIGKGKVVFGQVKVEDGKLEPEMVLAQMVIQPDGWFCTEVADSAKPLSFRAAGYLPQDFKLSEAADAMDLGTIAIKPLSNTDMATVKGKIVFEGPDGSKDLKATLNLAVPMPNTPTGGYSPRRKWPSAQTIKVEKDGTFEIANLTPGDHYLQLQSLKHEDMFQRVSLKAGESNELGKLTMKTTDLGFYLGKETPKGGKFPWEKDIETARKRAAAEGKPMMIMMTATWCGPCKMLESKTLSDGWVQQFLKDFVVVQAYEDKDVEKQYGLNGYPTLVFTDKTGKEVHRTVGYQMAGPFSGQILKAYQELGTPLDPDLKTLSEKKVIKAPQAAKTVPLKK